MVVDWFVVETRWSQGPWSKENTQRFTTTTNDVRFLFCLVCFCVSHTNKPHPVSFLHLFRNSPVIQLRSPYDSLPPLPVSTTTTATTTSAAMTTTTTTTAAADGVGVDDDHPHASSSPTSAGSSDTERSINSTSSGKAPLPISVVYMDDAAKPWHSPTSSLVNIYSSSSSSSSSSSQGAAPTESRGKAHTNGWTQKLPKLFGVSGYQPDHND